MRRCGCYYQRRGHGRERTGFVRRMGVSGTIYERCVPIPVWVGGIHGSR